MTMYNNKRLALSIFWVVLGAVLIVLTVTGKLDSSLYSGMGGALLAIGVLQVIKNLKYRTDPGYREKIDTEVNDERNRYLHMKSWSWAGYMTVIIEGIGVVVFTILRQQLILQVLSWSVCLLVFSYWVSYMILSRKY